MIDVDAAEVVLLGSASRRLMGSQSLPVSSRRSFVCLEAVFSRVVFFVAPIVFRCDDKKIWGDRGYLSLENVKTNFTY